MKKQLIFVVITVLMASLACGSLTSPQPATDQSSNTGTNQSRIDPPGLPYAVVYDTGSNIVALSNPPSLCARAGNTSSTLQFTGLGESGESHTSTLVSVNKGGVGCWQDSSPWSSGPYTWEVIEHDTAGYTSEPTSYELTIDVPSDSDNPFESSENCKIDALAPNLPSPQAVGAIVTFEVRASCSTGVNTVLLTVDGGTQASAIEPSVSSGTWMTLFDYPGTHIIDLYVIGNGTGFAHFSIPYILS